MSRRIGESTEQWSARASAEYHAAWDLLGVERRRLLTARFMPAGHYPAFDDRYDAAMDRLEEADNERGEASVALDRESRPLTE